MIGKRVIETDHKPLVPLMGQTNPDCLPPRVHFRIRLMRFDYSISHVPGKSLHTADALSLPDAVQVISGSQAMG